MSNKLGVLLLLMVRSVGVEPTTYGFEIRHSIQLNYERLFMNLIYIRFYVIL